MSQRPPVPEAQELVVSISALLRRLRQTRPSADLTPPEGQALATLVALAPMTSAELARREGISPQSAGVTLNGLVERGLVGRRADPEDGRRQLLELTEVGRQRALDKRDARVEQFAAALSEGFDPEERAVLSAAAPLLVRLADELGRVSVTAADAS